MYAELEDIETYLDFIDWCHRNGYDPEDDDAFEEWEFESIIEAQEIMTDNQVETLQEKSNGI